VAVVVIYGFEVIQVDKQETEPPLVAAGFLIGGLKFLYN
jgi:hypothetical protein